MTTGLPIFDGATSYHRVSKSRARYLWQTGQDVYIIAHKMRPGFPFSLGMTMGLSDEHKERGFDTLCQDFEYYNCTYETGYYPAFYRMEPAK